jgi:acyl-CoA hydrolase
MMQLKGSRTEKKLRISFSKELQAYVDYMYFAASSSETGYEQIAEIFLETARNESEHAKHEFRLLGGAEDIREILKKSSERENEESTTWYPEAAKVAEEEGFSEIAHFFLEMSKAERKHQEKFSELLEALDRGEILEGRTVGHSAVDMAQVMLPDQANPAGYVHGGELMKLMDNAAGVVAVRHCHSNVVTARADELHFLHPVRVGDLVLIHAKLTFASRSSMEVRVEVETEDLSTEKRVKALTANFIMVALNEKGRPKRLPPLMVCTEEEERLFNEGLSRYQARKSKTRKT